MHWFFYPIKNHYADFKGCVNRKEFWSYSLSYFLVFLAYYFLIFILLPFAINGSDLMETIFILLLNFSGIVFIGLLIPSVAITVRRLHDAGLSGLSLLAVVLLLIFLPYLGLLFFLVLMLLPSKLTSKYCPKIPENFDVD